MIIPIIIVLSLAILYISLSLFVFENDPLLGLLGRITDAYLLFQEGIANKCLLWLGSGVNVLDHMVMHEGRAYDMVTSGALMRKWIVLLLLRLAKGKCTISPSHWIPGSA